MTTGWWYWIGNTGTRLVAATYFREYGDGFVTLGDLSILCICKNDGMFQGEPGRFKHAYISGIRIVVDLLGGHLEERTVYSIVVRRCCFNLLAKSRLHDQTATEVAEVSGKKFCVRPVKKEND